jgi:hypothetical protein
MNNKLKKIPVLWGERIEEKNRKMWCSVEKLSQKGKGISNCPWLHGGLEILEEGFPLQ